jgi:hypothetical protein
MYIVSLLMYINKFSACLAVGERLLVHGCEAEILDF